ncbi:hypothetical protein AGMMS50268_30460 [Spirochaetia bacterium]|nr:hypothetical protein AGMMS50268_30460 [Spirochaetia bacterium]
MQIISPYDIKQIMVKLSQKLLPGRSRRLPLIVLTVFLALSAVFAEGFVFTHLDHDCIGDHCSVCLQIEIAQNVLEGLGRIGLCALAAGLITQILVIIKNRLRFSFFPQTLVGLKVQYNS